MASNLCNKRLHTPKVNKLQSPKLRLTQALLVATLSQNFMRFRRTVMEKRHQNFPTHSSVCDDLYRVCAFAWDMLCALISPHWKMLLRGNKRHSAPFEKGFYMISILKSFGEVIVSSTLRETKGYSPGFFFCCPKKSAEKSKPF